MKKIFTILFILIPLKLIGAEYPVNLGEDTVTIHVITKGHGKTFLHVHQNETTALLAAKIYVEKHGGKVITLKHNGQRNIVFHLKGERYEFDPNRIFTENGIKKTLTKFSKTNPEAVDEVNKLACKIKSLLPKGKVIAVHNNQNYSFKDYLKGHNLAKDAQKLNFCDKKNYRNFMLTTKESDYDRLLGTKFNLILQAQNPTDDGSLSVYLAKYNYINVEAGYNELKAQTQMLAKT